MGANRWIVAASLVLLALAGRAQEIRFMRVADGVYAHIGDKGTRSVDNQGFNANIGLVATARAQTRAHLEALRAHVKRMVEQGVDINEAVRSFDGSASERLLNGAELMAGNASRT